MWPALKGREALKVTWDESGAEKRGSRELIAEYRKLARTQGTVAGKHGDAEATETASAIVVGDGDLAQDLPWLHDGQHISFSLDGAECVFASDTSLPTGVPRCRAIAIVNPN